MYLGKESVSYEILKGYLSWRLVALTSANSNMLILNDNVTITICMHQISHHFEMVVSSIMFAISFFFLQSLVLILH